MSPESPFLPAPADHPDAHDPALRGLVTEVTQLPDGRRLTLYARPRAPRSGSSGDS